MNKQSSKSGSADRARQWAPDFIYSLVLLAAALVALAVLASVAGLQGPEFMWGTAGFFLVFGLFAIAVGFPHPVFGHVSFDRVAQVASILVLGPLAAACVNGVASFIYPWHRLRQGVPLPRVLMAAVHNSGLMIFVILGSGLLYQRLGGAVPLQELDLTSILLLLALLVAMQVINDLGMMLVVYLQRGKPRSVFNGFTSVVEFASGAAGVVLAAAFTQQSTTFFVLLLLVLVTGMLVIMQYARMRYRLEKLVEERTADLRLQAEEFERQATHDKLTKLPNRRHADDYLQQQINLAQRNERTTAVALADIDHFKRVNDDFSHAAGDRVLRRVALILREGCRSSDFVARYGGEEFLLCFPDTSIERALEVCGELRRAVQLADWSDIVSGMDVTISFGLAEIGNDSRRRTVLNEADLRLYRAKREGRNRVVAA
ncbi:MAG: GGDEF domain-containing protein [Chromatiales bacterium]|nr:MAG: GGDEF domain-containing protein [Chromatiales bacterium]